MPKSLKRLVCLLLGHQEELYRKRTDQRYLVWVCKRCDAVTRQMKLKACEMKMFRGKVKRIYYKS